MTRPGLRERKKQKTRWAIQEHALRLFAEQGYDATTVDQIAAAAEISPSTFFRYFRTKEDVVVEDQWDPIMIDAYATAPAELGPIAALRHAIRTAFQLMDGTERDKILARMRLQLAVPALRLRSLDNIVSSLDMIAGLLADRSGHEPTDPRVRALAGAIMGSWLAVLTAWSESDGTDDLAVRMDEALAFAETGFRL